MITSENSLGKVIKSIRMIKSPNRSFNKFCSWSVSTFTLLLFLQVKYFQKVMWHICHSARPFCTRHGRVLSLVGWAPGPSAWLFRSGGPEDRQAWIRRIFPPRMREDTSSYTHACMVGPTKVYKRRHIGLSQSVSPWLSSCQQPWT